MNCIIIAGLAYLSFFRARRAKLVFVICAIIGIAVGVVGLAWDFGWFVLGSEASRRLDYFISFGRGLALGSLLTHIFSGGKPDEATSRRHQV